MTRQSLCGLSAGEIFKIIEPWDYNLSHAVSIANSIFKRQIRDVPALKSVPKQLKNLLQNDFEVGAFMPVTSQLSSDGTEKYLFKSDDGKLFETVYIPDTKRNTLCLSTQSGCRMGCSFCATGNWGFHGNLSVPEIVNQFISIPHAGKITHAVFMGMGEPLDNLDNVLKACNIITSGWGLSLSPRNVTVSTVGITPAIEKFLSGCDCNLALSLFSPFPEERRSMIPVESKYPVKEIIDLLKDFPLGKRRRISLAYIMIKDLNDTGRHLDELRSLVTGSGLRVNLLEYHQAGSDTNTSSTPERMMYFKHNLVISGVSASIRRSRGADISAACGLLATR